LKANHQIWTSWHAVVEALLIVLASAHRNTIWPFIMALELKCNELWINAVQKLSCTYPLRTVP
jgi:hypothetical protein